MATQGQIQRARGAGGNKNDRQSATRRLHREEAGSIMVVIGDRPKNMPMTVVVCKRLMAGGPTAAARPQRHLIAACAGDARVHPRPHAAICFRPSCCSSWNCCRCCSGSKRSLCCPSARCSRSSEPPVPSGGCHHPAAGANSLPMTAVPWDSHARAAAPKAVAATRRAGLPAMSSEPTEQASAFGSGATRRAVRVPGYDDDRHAPAPRDPPTEDGAPARGRCLAPATDDAASGADTPPRDAPPWAGGCNGHGSDAAPRSPAPAGRPRPPAA